jgi:hypothetical protein
MHNFHHANQPATATFSHAGDPCARLNWLTHWNAEAERRLHLFRNAREEQELLSMRRPLTTEQTYARFGLLLGALVPAAIFLRALLALETHERTIFFMLFSIMNLICALVGWRMGRLTGRNVAQIERRGWNRMFFHALGKGMAWGAATGAAGGLIVFGLGALVGAAIATPIGIAAFAVFTLLHRLMARGGMIDARHFWPLASGVVLTISALILSPYL